MSSRTHKRPEPCGEENCGSRRFHVGDDGYTYCDQGHQQSHRGTVIAEDTGELVQLGRKQRRHDSDAESTRSRSRGFTGSQALEQYLLALQLILRKQVSWLITIAKLPAALEGITRDLWALRLRRLQGRVSYDSETDTEGQSQVFSSQSEGESAGSQTTRGNSRRKQQAKTDGAISISETLVICYIGTLLLRVPFTVVDLISRVDSGEMIYYQAGKEVPANLKERLPGQFQTLLEPQAVLRASSLQYRILELGTLFSTEFEMVMPAINHPLLLYRWMQELALPIEVYAATQRLSRLLGIDFTLKLGRKTSAVLRHPEVQLMALLIVSTKLFFPFDDIDRHPTSANDLSALQMDWQEWVATHNSAQPDQSGRGDSDNNNTKTNTSSRMTFPEAFKISESDCLAMGDEELDRYLDWYQENLASESVREHGRAGRDADFRRTLIRMFPTQSSRPTVSPANVQGEGEGENTSLADKASDTTQRLRQVQQALRPKKIVVSAGDGEHGGDDVARVGSFYRRHREAKDLDGPVRVFYTKAAELAGVSLESMTKAAFLTESKLQKREESARKAGEDDSDE